MIDAKELRNMIKVVKTAKKLGVKSMKIGTLEFSFTEDSDTHAPRPAFKRSSKQVPDHEHQKIQDTFDSVKDDLSVMHVEDPRGFENALIENLLEDDAREGMLEETHTSRAE